jgi:hypothetical protein
MVSRLNKSPTIWSSSPNLLFLGFTIGLGGLPQEGEGISASAGCSPWFTLWLVRAGWGAISSNPQICMYALWTLKVKVWGWCDFFHLRWTRMRRSLVRQFFKYLQQLQPFLFEEVHNSVITKEFLMTFKCKVMSKGAGCSWNNHHLPPEAELMRSALFGSTMLWGCCPV